MAAIKYLYKDNDNLIKLEGVKNIVTDSWVNSSSGVTARLVNTADLSEVIAAWSLAYVAASDGNYQATLDQASLDSVTVGSYYIEYVVDETGMDLKILQHVSVAERILA